MKLKQLLFILITFLSLHASGQFDSKTYYKHNEIEGWIKCVETNWFTVSQQGDTTFYSQLLEDTNQDDPNERPKYEFNGAGVHVVHDTVKVHPAVTYTKTVDSTLSVSVDESALIDNNSIQWRTDSFYTTKNIYKKGKHTKGKNSVRYKTRYKYRHIKSRPEIQYIAKKPKPVETIKFIDYKKRLWMVVSKSGTVTMLDSSNERTALAKFKKISGAPVLSITEFQQNDIVK